MLFRCLLLVVLLVLGGGLRAAGQAAPADTTARQLPAATVVGYGQRLPARRTAASISTLDAAALGRFAEGNLAAAVNTLPGVRLEERAPGSYRLSVRGSARRSPFGVRNVKVYYHDIPLTDASGSTPLNLLDPALLGRVEVLRGPAGSAYGAGTGGVVRFETPELPAAGWAGRAGATAGAYGLRRLSGAVAAGGSAGAGRVQYARQEYAGYRANSALRRDVLTLDAATAYRAGRTGGGQQLALHALFADLYYQLPGGLTAAQAAADPRQARPDAGPGRPGTVAQRASYATQTGLLGVTHTLDFSAATSLTTTLYGTGGRVQTPFLVDLERNATLGGGGRMVGRHRTALLGRGLRLAAGAEFQTSFERARNYANQAGTPGALRYDDAIRTRTGFAFAQADWELSAAGLLSAGLSANRLRYRIAREAAGPDFGGPAGVPTTVARQFRPAVLPRLAYLHELAPGWAAYGSASAGYSPPTEEELRPSDGSRNLALQAERGTSWEVGLRGTAGQQRLTAELTGYWFDLRRTIVAAPDALGTQTFRNAGTTHQRGLEATGRARLLGAAAPAASPAAPGLNVWFSYAWQRFRFGAYPAPGGADYRGHQPPGTAPHTLSAGLDAATRAGLYAAPTLSYLARQFLDDANTATAPAYWLLGARIGWRYQPSPAWGAEVYASVENATDRAYSLGPDVNGFGGRYFQPSPGRSFAAGLALRWR